MQVSAWLTRKTVISLRRASGLQGTSTLQEGLLGAEQEEDLVRLQAELLETQEKVQLVNAKLQGCEDTESTEDRSSQEGEGVRITGL